MLALIFHVRLGSWDHNVKGGGRGGRRRTGPLEMALGVLYSVSFWNKCCLPQPLTVAVIYMSTIFHSF